MIISIIVVVINTHTITTTTTTTTGEYRPKKMTESDGTLGRVMKAIDSTQVPPLRDDWDDYILENARLDVLDTTTKKVEQIDLVSDVVIKVWDSIVAASRATNIPSHVIKACLSGKSPDGGGYRWKQVQVDTTVERSNKNSEEEVCVGVSVLMAIISGSSIAIIITTATTIITIIILIIISNINTTTTTGLA